MQTIFFCTHTQKPGNEATVNCICVFISMKSYENKKGMGQRLLVREALGLRKFAARVAWTSKSLNILRNYVTHMTYNRGYQTELKLYCQYDSFLYLHLSCQLFGGTLLFSYGLFQLQLPGEISDRKKHLILTINVLQCPVITV